MKFKVTFTLIFLLFTGCAFHSEPEGNREFHQISQLSELAGVYKNKGNPSGYLSLYIFPEIIKNRQDKIQSTSDIFDFHEDIDFIEVIPKDDSLIIKAISNDCSIYSKTYILNRDFKISDGKIIIHSESHMLTRGRDDVLLGPSSDKLILGLDTEKNGKSRQSSYGAGLIFMLMPVSISEVSDVRYERVSDKPKMFNDCSNR